MLQSTFCDAAIHIYNCLLLLLALLVQTASSAVGIKVLLRPSWGLEPPPPLLLLLAHLLVLVLSAEIAALETRLDWPFSATGKLAADCTRDWPLAWLFLFFSCVANPSASTTELVE
jgi:hypothetical protein